MKKATLVVPPSYQQNRLFDLTNSHLNRDNCLAPFAELKARFAKQGFDLSTQDINANTVSDCVIYLEMPDVLPAPENVNKSFLLLFETELILPQNWDFEKHRNFSKIFTWNDSLVDNKKYFKMNWSHVFPDKIEYQPSEKTKFCCLIAGNKILHHELELYSKRLEAIRWFEKQHPDEFDLYGIGWNEIKLPGKSYFERYYLLKLIKKVLNLLAPRFSSYRGKVADKRQVLKQYRYSICYENVRDLPGYITEKIFDCFFAACIPVYWGPANITSHIPAECFIDKQKFNTYEELYSYLASISESEYVCYIDAAAQYLRSTQALPFRAAAFVDTIVANTIGQNS